MEKKMGRPTDNPKTKRLEIRLSAADEKMLLDCMEITGASKTETIMQSLRLFLEQNIDSK